MLQVSLLSFVLWLLLHCCSCGLSGEIRINNHEFPKSFCNQDGQNVPYQSLIGGNESIKIVAQLMRQLKAICRYHYVFLQQTKMPSISGSLDAQNLLSLFSEASDMRKYCRLANQKIRKTVSGDWKSTPYATLCHRNSTKDHKAWDHISIYKFQSCILLYLMCVCCYVYGRIMALDISPIARLRRLNWTKENFIWAYKNF